MTPPQVTPAVRSNIKEFVEKPDHQDIDIGILAIALAGKPEYGNLQTQQVREVMLDVLIRG